MTVQLPSRAEASTGFAERIFAPPPPVSAALRRTALPPRLRADASLGILDITEFFGETSGGVRRYLAEKGRYVETRPQYRHTIVVPGPRDAIVDTDGVRCYRVRGPRVPGQPPYRFMVAARSSRRIFAHERPDIAEVGSPGFVPWIARHSARGLDVPMVYFFHSNFPRILCPSPERPLQRPFNALLWQYAKFIDRFFAVTIVSSRFAGEELLRAGVDRVVRIPLGADVDQFHPQRRSARERTRQLLGLSGGPVFAYVGRFGADKEVDVLANAWPEIERQTGATLLMVGAGPLEGWLRRQLHGWRVTIIPYVHDREQLANLLAAVDAYIAPSSVETFGLAAIEAMASGTPVVAANRGGVAENVEGARAGTVFEAGSSASLVERAVWLMRENLGEHGARARAYAETNHRWEDVFDRIFAVYQRVRSDAADLAA